MKKDNIIPFPTDRIGKNLKAEHNKDIDYFDITQKRQNIILEERRNVKRTILTEFVSAHVIIPKRGLQSVALHDISSTGVAVDLEAEEGQFYIGEKVAMRVYLNHETYFPFSVTITNKRFISEEEVYRYGGRFISQTVNFDALFHFAKFLEHVSASLATDRGDIMVSQMK